MKKIYLVTLLLVLTSFSLSFSQIFQPVKWSFETKQLNQEEFELILKASMDKGWHIYGLDTLADGPIPTSFKFIPSADYEPVGKLIIPESHQEYDEMFGMDISYFSGVSVFKQKIRIKSAKPFVLTGETEHQACDDTKCIAPEITEFSFNLPGVKAAKALPDVKSSENVVIPAANGQKEKAVVQTPAEEITSTPTVEKKVVQQTADEIVSSPKEETKKDASLWSFFFLALGIGFIGLLTPCVYPMIPMTVTFFMNASQNKLKAKSQAIFFGLSIIFIYTVIGILVSVLFGADTIKQVSEHWITNLIFFLLFAVFAASFFGMFELVLPAWLTNKSDQQADKGGYIGAFFMALTLVLVSFSCTAPFVGGILVEAATGQVLKPTIGMFGFSLAFGLVFTLLALFPAWLNKMPKSGGWLNSVKVVLAFLILFIGMKYLNVPNQALGWGITREVFIAVWIVLFALLGMYLLGKIKFSHDSPVDHISVPRLVLVIAAFSFAIYLVPGLFGAPLKAVSGYLPTESAWDLDDIIRENTKNISVISSGTVSTSANMCEVPKYADRFSLPHGLKGYFEYEQGLACAKKLNKPVFLDIKGHACTNCKVMEKNIWSDPEVLKRLNNDFVIVALYVDDNYELPENEWITSTFDGKVKKTIGRKNTDFQITRFGVNAQPYYVILDPSGNALTEGVGFVSNVYDYVAFLDKGVEAFKK